MLALSSAVATCGFGQTTSPAHIGPNKEMTQISTINALIKGGFDGSVPVGELRKLGSFGIGTLDHLDGEMITLDGKVYQMAGDGHVNPVPDTTTTPFASVTNFQPDETFPVKDIKTFADLQSLADTKIPSLNFFYAIKVHGQFPHIKVRSVPRQEKPYRPLTTILKEQSIFEFKDTSGTLVGFRCPDYVQGVNVAAYHMHFISDDKTHGGHVLDFELTDGEVSIDNLSNFRMILPEDPEFMKMNLGDRGDEAIHKVEKLMGDPAKDK
jgi:acetolactate decarboxylase